MTKLTDANLDEYSSVAAARILARFPDWERFAKLHSSSGSAENSVDFDIPCPSAAVDLGLWISTAHEELTVGFHTHHRHFTDYAERTHPEQIEAGLNYASAILEEHIGVVSYYHAGKFSSSSSVKLPPPENLPSLFQPKGLAKLIVRSFFPDWDLMTVRSWSGRFDQDLTPN